MIPQRSGIRSQIAGQDAPPPGPKRRGPAARRAEVTSKEEAPRSGATLDTTAKNACLAAEHSRLDLG
jgi:hypothetical protein